ncbi:hypothetical protein STEG23_004220, partial [Scotinomys teguina]
MRRKWQPWQRIGHRFSSVHPHSSSKPFVTPNPGDQMPSSDLHRQIGGNVVEYYSKWDELASHSDCHFVPSIKGLSVENSKLEEILSSPGCFDK